MVSNRSKELLDPISSNLEAIPAVSLASGPPQSARHSVRRSFFGMVEVGSDIGSESKQFQMSCNEFNSVKVSPSESPLVPVNASEVGSNEFKTLSK